MGCSSPSCFFSRTSLHAENEPRQSGQLVGGWLLPQSPFSYVWAGLMQTANNTRKYEKANIVQLSFIDRDPTQPKQYSQQCCFITFDQLLDGVNLTLRGFHFVITYMGSTGYAMLGADIDACRETVYGGNSVAQATHTRRILVTCSLLHR